MNQDKLKRFANQNLENRQTECVGETVSDLIGNIVGQPCDAGFSYATALKVMNQVPTTAGSDPYAGMLGGMIYGALPTDKVPFDVNISDELFEANINNYSPGRELAYLFAQNGVKQLYSYGEIQGWLSMNKGGVSLALQWYPNFSTPQNNGLLTEPEGLNFTYHDVGVWDNPQIGLQVKPYLGPNYGAGGYGFLNERVFDEVFISAFAYNPSAWRWLSLAYAGVTRPYLLGDILPMLGQIK